MDHFHTYIYGAFAVFCGEMTEPLLGKALFVEVESLISRDVLLEMSTFLIKHCTAHNPDSTE